MSAGENLESIESGCPEQENSPPTGSQLDCGNRSGVRLEEEEEEEEDDEDVGFNPLLEEIHSSDGLSSLISEVDGVDGVDGEIQVNSFHNMEINSSELTDEVQSRAIDDSEHCEEGKLFQGTPCAEVCEAELPEYVAERLPDGDLEASSHNEDDAVQQEEGQRNDKPDSSGIVEEDEDYDRKALVPSNDEDAIFNRTRARYSLAGFTLDELESFLQETDDDDDLQNVDDEEEYRKFLAAVLGAGDGDNQSVHEIETFDDEDEDNDADFEIELEEALESDLDERPIDKEEKGCHDGFRRRPETRQNRCQKVHTVNKSKLLEQGRRPLRPLLPILTVGYNAPLTSTGKSFSADPCPSHGSFTAESGFINGFTPHQLGQLYCLVHEHVQLLIQIYSLSVLDPSRQQVASMVQELLLDLVLSREDTLAWRSVPYPAFCFFPPYICPTVPDWPCRFNQAHYTLGSCPSSDAQIVGLSPDNQIPAVWDNSRFNEQRQYGFNGAVGSPRDPGAVWLPYISGPVLSILDVSPLNLVKNYLENVAAAVQENHRRHVESSCDFHSEKEPLFPLPSYPSATEVDGQVSNGSGLLEGRNGPLSSGRQLKRSLATALVESTKRQSVALVPKDIAKLAQIFYPLFNRTLFPHKPPLAAAANRVLFTDAEDELLALGIMEYNTDWKKIQQRFLPCKSKHQIFVRQKNRCSSKAPENPIKAVRRMKTSPLTPEEMQYIQEGLKIYKLDWMSVWQYVVPHRDPSLLPRQWRVALGIQKSYKQDPAKRAKRCMYEAERRRRRAAFMGGWQDASEKEAHSARGENSSGDDCVDDPEEAYVHEAFLADWIPGTVSQVSSDQPCSSFGKGNPADYAFFQGIHMREQPYRHIYREVPNHAGNGDQFSFASNFMQTQSASHLRGSCGSTSFIDPASGTNDRTSITQLSRRSSRGYRVEGAQLVKLAPNLPPVNLPRNVRVMSASAFNHDGAVSAISVAEGSGKHRGIESVSHQASQVENLEVVHVTNANDDTSTTVDDDSACLQSEELAANREKCTKGDRGNDTGIPMHPLLFQSPGDAHLSYYLRNSSSLASSSSSFFSHNQPQLNLSLFHNSHRPNQVATCLNKSQKPSGSTFPSYGIDFHPLLGRTDNVNTEMRHTRSGTELSAYVNGVQARKQANGSSLAACTSQSDHSDKAHKLDLNIHPNSTPTVEKTVDITDWGIHKTMRHKGDRTPVDPPELSNRPSKQPENFASVRCEPLMSIVTCTDGVPRCDDNMVGDSHPEIVMEQEELSDSEEDIEEHVEFECEEMADSEGEGESATDLCANSLNKEVHNPESEKGEVRAGHIDNCDAMVPGKGSIPFVKLGLTGERKDMTSKSWLSLDSCAGGRPTNAESQPGTNIICKNNVCENYVSSCSNGSRKKRPISKNDAAEPLNQSAECTKQQEQDRGTFVGPLRRPRKRACRKNASSNLAVEDENSNFAAQVFSMD